MGLIVGIFFLFFIFKDEGWMSKSPMINLKGTQPTPLMSRSHVVHTNPNGTDCWIYLFIYFLRCTLKHEN